MICPSDLPLRSAPQGCPSDLSDLHLRSASDARSDPRCIASGAGTHVCVYAYAHTCTYTQARTLIEHSYAIKCPSVAQQLAGTKKVQQVLAKPAEIERFMSAAESLTLRESFAGLYGLEADGGAEVRVRVRVRPLHGLEADGGAEIRVRVRVRPLHGLEVDGSAEIRVRVRVRPLHRLEADGGAEVLTPHRRTRTPAP